MVIDAHHHLGQEADYADKLIDTMAKLGIDKTVLLATSTSGPGSSNEQIAKAVQKHPDTLIGFGWVDPALDPNAVDTVQRLHDSGFKGLKFIKTRKAYDDRSYIPTYQKAADLEMPILFHQGIVARHADDIKNDVHSGRMMPVHLDYIARQVPELVMIGAHLGNPWWYEGGMVLRWNPNLYMDITGSTLKMLAPEDVGKILWWRRDSQYRDPWGRDAWEKIVFGTDVPYFLMEDVMNDYRNCMDLLGVPPDIQKGVWGDTMAKILTYELSEKHRPFDDQGGHYPHAIPQGDK